MTKKCTGCKLIKTLDSFHNNKNTKDGKRFKCKDCVKLHNKDRYIKNSQKIKDMAKKYREENREEVLAKKRQWSRKRKEEHPEKERERRRKYNKKFKHKKNYYTAKRRAMKKNATPKWLSDFDKDYIKHLHAQSLELSKIGEKINVDHIIPLQSERVCGLDVPWNLQLITYKENVSKSNKFDGTNDNETWKKEIK